MTSTMLRIALAASAVAVIAATPSAAMAKTTHHKVADRNHDRIPDTWERKFKLSLHVNQAKRDQDKDGLNNRAEFLANTSPRSKDSDHDGTKDGQENAGKVVSFDGTTLVIDLFGGKQISAAVTADTEIQCKTGAGAAHPTTPNARKSDKGGNEGSGENENENENDQGDTEDDTEDAPPAGTTVPANGSGHHHGGQPGQTTPGHQGDDENENEGEHGGDATCPGDALTLLVPGAVIHEGSIDIAGGDAVWHEITVVI